MGSFMPKMGTKISYLRGKIMSNKLKNKTKLPNNGRNIVASIAKDLVDQTILDGLMQYSVDGIIEAKWKLVGIANLLKRLGVETLVDRCVLEVNRMDTLLNIETARAGVWQNLKEAMEASEEATEEK